MLDRAKGMGLTVGDAMSTKVYELMDRCPRVLQQRLGVEFISMPYNQPGASWQGRVTDVLDLVAAAYDVRAKGI